MDDPRNRSTLRSLKESGISLLRFMFTGHPFQVFAVSLAELMFLFYAWVMAGIPLR